MGTGVYKYGLPLGPDAEVREAVWQQIRAGHAYQNTLIEIENRYRDARRELCRADPEVARLISEMSEIHKQIEDEKLSEKDGNKQLKALSKQLSVEEARVRQNPDVKQQFDVLWAARNAQMIEARAQTTAYWGTYLLIEESHDQACGMTPLYRNVRFRRFDGSGRIGVQLQGGVNCARLFGCKDTRIRMQPSEPGRKARVGLQFRIGSTDKGKPVWASFTDLAYHRAIPPDADIKWAVVHAKRIGTRTRWTIDFVLNSQVFDAEPVVTGDTLAVNVGWRAFRDEPIRVGFCTTTAGRSVDVRVPEVVRSRLKHADSLRSIQDKNFDVARKKLSDWLADRNVPPWLHEQTKSLSSWKSAARLVRVVRQWTKERFEGDEDIYPELEAWRKQHRHLYGWECDERAKAVGVRNDFFRCEALRILKGVRTLVVEDTDIPSLIARSKMEQKELPTDEATMKKRASSNRQKMAPGEFRSTLVAAAHKAGVQVKKVKSQDITAQCHVCGELCDWDHARELVHSCEHCGAKWDQDFNAARNLLAFSQRPERRKRPLADSSASP